MGSFLLIFEMKVILAILGAAAARFKVVSISPYRMPCDGSDLDQGEQALLNYCSKVFKGWPETSWCSKCNVAKSIYYCKYLWAYADNWYGNGRRRLLDDNDPS